MDGKGVKRHEIVTGISAPDVRQRRTQPANDNEDTQQVHESQPTQENGVVAPVQVSGRPTRARQSPVSPPVQETGQQRDDSDRQYRAGRLTINRLTDALWHATMAGKQQEAKEADLESEKRKIEEAKEKLERENEQHKTKLAQKEQQLKDKQSKMEELTNQRDTQLASLREKIEQLKSHTTSVEKDRCDQKAQFEQQLAEVEKEFHKKIQHCQEEIDDLEAKLKECHDLIHKHECDIMKLEGKIEMLTELLEKYKDLFIVAKRRAICAHWVGGVLALVAILAVIVIGYVLFEIVKNRFCGWYW